MSLFTMILDYKGGTYIRQISSDSLRSALKEWGSVISEQEFASWGLSRTEIKGLIEGNPTPVEDCTNVWCATGSGKSGLILLNIVTTSR